MTRTALWAGILSKRSLELVCKGGKWIVRKGGKILNKTEADKVLREAAEALMNKRRSEIKLRGGIQGHAPADLSGVTKDGTKWWEYTTPDGKKKLMVEHADGSVHVGAPKPQSTHRDGGEAKYFEDAGIHANGCQTGVGANQ